MLRLHEVSHKAIEEQSERIGNKANLNSLFSECGELTSGNFERCILAQEPLDNLGHTDPCLLAEFIHSHYLYKVLVLESLDFDIQASERGLDIRVLSVYKINVFSSLIWVLSIVLIFITPHLCKSGVRAYLMKGLCAWSGLEEFPDIVELKIPSPKLRLDQHKFFTERCLQSPVPKLV